MLPSAASIITDARVLANAQNYSETEGISQDALLVHFKKAIHKLQAAIVATQARANAAYSVIPAPSALYIDVPIDCFSGTAIYGVEFSKDGSENTYYDLEVMSTRGDGKVRDPSEFSVIGRKIYFDSTVSSGYVRVCYEKTFRDIDTPRGQVDSYSAVALEIALANGIGETFPPDDTKLATTPLGHASVVAFGTGVVKARRIPILSYDSSSKRLEILSPYALETGEAIASGDVVVSGYDASTHPEGEVSFYDYFVEYLKWQIERMRSKLDAPEDSRVAQAILLDIVNSYDDEPYGRVTVPIVR